MHNTEHINGVILEVEKGELAMQGKVVAHKDGTYHFDADVFLSPERYPKPQEESAPETKPVRHELQGEFMLTKSPKLKPLILA